MNARDRLGSIGVTLALVVLAATSPARAGEDADVIVAKVQPDVVLVWRVNDAYAKIVAGTTDSRKTYDLLLAQAVTRMVSHAGDAAHGSSTVTMRLVFSHDSTDPRYKTEAMSGMDTLGTLAAPAAALAHHGASWETSLSHDKLPPGLTIHVEQSSVDTLRPN